MNKMTKFNLINWNKADVYSAEGSSAIKKAIEIKLNDKFDKAREAHLNYFTMRSDFPTDGYPELEKITRNSLPDLGWQLAFGIRDYTSSNGAGGEAGFDVAVAGSGLTVAAVADGMKAKVFEAQGDSIRVPFVRYAGGLLYLNNLVEDGRWWDLEDTVNEATYAFNNAVAQSHYALMDAMGAGINVAWQDQGDTTLENAPASDAATINTAINEIIVAAGGWQGIGVNTQFAVIAPIELASRLQSAINYTQNGVKLVGYEVLFAKTTFLTSSSVYYVVPVQEAGRTGIRKGMELKFDEEILADATTMLVQGRWGSALLGESVIRRCATA